MSMTKLAEAPLRTPLMQQYDDIKEQHPDAILFFRLGDFYEMFGDDAKIASPILEVALTHRQQVPMCGVPYHAANQYIAKLIKRGFRVAVCEQIDDNQGTGGNKNLFTRRVVHTITPGTLIEENLLNARAHNYLASVYIDPMSDAGKTRTVGVLRRYFNRAVCRDRVC
jgi:DNA mismatch repair protein MutS